MNRASLHQREGSTKPGTVHSLTKRAASGTATEELYAVHQKESRPRTQTPPFLPL